MNKGSGRIFFNERITEKLNTSEKIKTGILGTERGKIED